MYLSIRLDRFACRRLDVDDGVTLGVEGDDLAKLSRLWIEYRDIHNLQPGDVLSATVHGETLGSMGWDGSIWGPLPFPGAASSEQPCIFCPEGS